MSVLGLPGYFEVLLISVAASFVSVLIYKYVGDQKAVKNVKAEMAALNARIKKAQKAGNTAEVSKLSGQLMKISGKQFQYNMKPMMVSMVMFIALFWFFGQYYSDLIVPLPITIPFVGNELTWFGWYFIIVMPSSFLFRKLFAVE